MMMIDTVITVVVVLAVVLVAVLLLVLRRDDHHTPGEVSGKDQETELLRMEVVVSRLLIVDLGRDKVEMIMQRYADALRMELENQHRSIDRREQKEAPQPQG